MKLTSNWTTSRLFWRTFTNIDIGYVVGLRQGFLSNGETAEYENPAGLFQMEIKRDGLFGPTLVPAGHVFNNEDEFIFGDDGRLIGIEDAANVIVDTGFKFENYNSSTQFFGAGSADSTIKITSSLTQTTTVDNTKVITASNEATNEMGSEVGGKTNLTIPGELKFGIEVTGKISNKVTNKISRIVANTLGIQVATTTAYSEEQSVTLKAGKFTAIKTSWQRKFVTGTVQIGRDTFRYGATLGFLTSRQIQEYGSPDELPPELMAEYRAQNPDFLALSDLVDGKLLREMSSAPVYVIFGRAKFHVPDPEVLKRLYGGWTNVMVVGDHVLTSVTTIPRDGTILREEHDGHVYLIENGNRRHITSPTVLFRYGGWNNVRIVPDGATSAFSNGDPII